MYKLIVDDLHKKFGDNEVLKGVSLQAKAGDVISLIGSSGSGKSTFLRCINFLESPCSGRITLNGEAIRTSTDRSGSLRVSDPKQLRAMRTRLSMVFQHFNLWAHMTVLENIIEAPVSVLGLKRDEAEERARKYLAKVGLANGVEHKYPSHLSGGQQQRVAIARALAMEPEVMLFDEPTSALDPEMVKEVLDTMVALAMDGMTMLVVTHEMAFARQVASRIVFMDGGEIVEINTAGPFFEKPQHERTRLFLSQILQ